MGHSMGGHGALLMLLKTTSFNSVSVIAPVCNPKNFSLGIEPYKLFFKDSE